MPQQQQSNMVKPQKIMKMKKGMKGGQQGFLNSKKSPVYLSNKNMRSKISATNPIKKNKGKKGASNSPSFSKVAKSVKKTMGY